jgi:hypothetical protein
VIRGQPELLEDSHASQLDLTPHEPATRPWQAGGAGLKNDTRRRRGDTAAAERGAAAEL